MSKNNKIKINDNFYRYIDPNGIFHYIVKGIRKYEEDEMYELECQSCSHDYKCLLLCGFDDKNKLQYIRMLNEDEDNHQAYWHQDAGEFYNTKKEAMISKLNRMKQYWFDEVKKAEKTLKNRIAARDTELKQVEAMIEALNE